jgi:hypothetical protein
VIFELVQGLSLPLLLARGRLDDAVFEAIEKGWALDTEPFEDIPGEPSVVRASLDNLRPSRDTQTLRPFCFLQPIGELEGEQFTEQAADTDAGKKISFLAYHVPFLFVVSINGTVQGQLHEAGEGDGTLFRYRLGD